MRAALRSLAHAPAFTLIAIVTIGLGVGANTAIFSVVDAVVLRPLPYPQPQQLVSVRERDSQYPSKSDSYPDYLDWVADNRSFSSLGAYRGNSAVLTHAGPPVVISGLEVTAPYFTVLGIKPELGRTLLPAEDHAGGPDVVVIADALWRQRLGADPAIIGKPIELNSRVRTIVGVMPPGFPGLQPAKDATQYWISLGAATAQEPYLMNRGSHPGINALGRMKQGVTLAQARADMNAIARTLAQTYPKSNAGESMALESLLDRAVGDAGTVLWLLLGAVGLVLLIACANVANLVLARAAAQHRVLAIRAALGASRLRLLRERMAECLCLGAAGAALGLGLALVAMHAAPGLIPPEVLRADQAGLDWRVLAFTVGAALATTFLFGMAPAWFSSRVRLAEVLKEGGRDRAAGRAGNRLRAVLVAAEMALALVLLVGAGLLLRSMVQLRQVNPGFDPHHLLTFDISLPNAKYANDTARAAFMRQVRLRLAALPGVVAVGGTEPLPFSDNDWENSFTIAGRPAPPPGNEPDTNYAQIQGAYFRALGMTLLRGRSFDDRDAPTSTPVAIIDDSFARKYWPGPDPLAAALGAQITPDAKTRTIVGIVARVMDYDLDPAGAAAAGATEDVMPETFVPYTQGSDLADADFVVRTTLSDPLALETSAAAQIQVADPDQPLDDVMTMDQRIAASLAGRRLTLWLMAAFAALALALAGIGIYGVIAYSVAQRTHEIGVRMALGADASRVRAMVLGHGLRLAAAGGAVGLFAAIVGGRLARSFLYGVKSYDPATLLAVPALLLAVAALACYLPARRATRVDPLIALRGD